MAKKDKVKTELIKSVNYMNDEIIRGYINSFRKDYTEKIIKRLENGETSIKESMLYEYAWIGKYVEKKKNFWFIYLQQRICSTINYYIMTHKGYEGMLADYKNKSIYNLKGR